MKRLVILFVTLMLSALSLIFLFNKQPSEVTKATEAPNIYECVDLGLSVNWATCNVGATNPSDYGYYFVWGETTPKDEYEWENLRYCLDSERMRFSKYVTDSEFGTVDKRIHLELKDDAANVNWGGSWRTPTKEEMDEIRTQCNWEQWSIDGHNCYKVISKKNGNYVYLPAAGLKGGTDLIYDGLYGCYWTSSLIVDGRERGNSAAELHFNGVAAYDSFSRRHLGRSVRPVCPR